MNVVIGYTRLSNDGFETKTIERELLTDSRGAVTESLREFARRVRKATLRNIRRGASESNWPSTGALGRTFNFALKTTGKKPFVIVELGEGLLYGGNINAPEGTFTEIYATGPVLKFYWWKWGKKMRIYKPGAIMYPGKAYLANAFEEVSGQLDSIVEEILNKGK